ncbi:hypothetical protein, partial [Dickeya dadantii]|uniref:hypothetical protein n=1 Tax=Dickeya dadantii TaxID=204038 RepID=UPI001C12F7C5
LPTGPALARTGLRQVHNSSSLLFSDAMADAIQCAHCGTAHITARWDKSEFEKSGGGTFIEN